jgi:hypothetical protein
VVIIAGVIGWSLPQSSSAWGVSETWSSEKMPVVSAAGIPEVTGFENIYIIAHGAYDPNENLSGHENMLSYQGQPAVIEGDGWNISIPYETPFDIVATAKGTAPDNLAYAAKENIRVQLVLSGAISWEENSPDVSKYVFENENYESHTGWIRVNFVFDNSGNGWTLRAGQSLDWTATLLCWG